MKRRSGFPNHPGSRPLFFILSILTVIETGAIIAQAVYIATAISSLFEGAPVSSQFENVSLFFVMLLLRHGVTFIKRSLAQKHAIKTATMLRSQLLDRTFRLGQAHIAKEGTGKAVTLAIEGIQDIQTYLHITIPRMIQSVIVPIGIAIYVWTVDSPSAYVLVGVIPVIVMFMVLLGYAAQRLANKQYATYRLLANHFIDSLKGLETLAFLGQSKRHGKNIKRVSQDYRKATMRTLRAAFSSSFALDFFTSLAIAFVAVGLGLKLIDGTIVLLPALTVLILAPEYFLPIRQVGTDYHATLDGQIALAEVEKMIELGKNVPYVAQSDTRLKWEKNSSISFENVSVTVVDDSPILKEVNFSFTGPGLVGIVGPSGAGKTTILHTLAGSLQPEKGKITIDGKTVPHLHRADWLEQIAFIPQRPYLFPLSIADNIRFYQPEATTTEIEQVIEQIGLKDFVQSLPNGIDEKIGEGGRQLSGGQEQRIAIARALLSDRAIILLDEPTAHLDIETEYELKEIMMDLFATKTVFFVTHRMHWLKQMDHLLMMKDGGIVESGTYEQLKAKTTGAFNQLTKTMKQRRMRL